MALRYTNVLKKYYPLDTVFHVRCLFLAVNVGDEGGFAPNLGSIVETLDLIMDAFKESGHLERMAIALDVAASGSSIKI